MLSTHVPSLCKRNSAVFLALEKIALSSVDESAGLYLEITLSFLKDRVLIRATVWMNLDDIMLSEIVRFLLYEVPRVVRFIDTETRMVVTRVRGEGGMGS